MHLISHLNLTVQCHQVITVLGHASLHSSHDFNPAAKKTFQLVSECYCIFPHLSEQGEGAAGDGGGAHGGREDGRVRG